MNDPIYASLIDAIHDIYGNDRAVAAKNFVPGGDINEAYALTLDDGTVLFMKSNAENAVENFIAEAEGLEAIRNTHTISSAKVLGIGTDKNHSFLLLEYIAAGKRIADYWETFALELAAMHRSDAGAYYGFVRDNWIGTRPQKNDLCGSWIAFFRDCRLKPQFQAAEKNFSTSELKKIDWLLEHLDRYLIEPERPSLVHGDLWAGNIITGTDGKGWLIDPAVYFGCAEVDIAMTELFGGYSGSFYEAYKETGLLKPGYEDRRDLYNLYQLLNHLNMFGRSYLHSVMRIVRRYARYSQDIR